jgi:porphobilinogen synthase
MTVTIDKTYQAELKKRPRRNRQTAAVRSIIRETTLAPSNLIVPLFIVPGTKNRIPVDSMPGIDRLSIDLAVREVEELYHLGVRGIDLFSVVPSSDKDADGSEAWNPDGLIQQAIKAIRQEVPEMWVMADVALDPFTTHGHDGILDEHGFVLNDPTIDALGRMAVSCAEAGAHMIAPSDMMDGRVAYIRNDLDMSGFPDVGILAYAAKYASAFYGPFRDALNSAPKFGDKRGYQLDPANRREAVLEAILDEQEGADMLMVKPALPYLDVLAEIRKASNLPIGAYHVSGEYAMVMAAAQNGWIDGDKVLYESLMSIRRAGADFILTYGAKQVIPLLETLGNIPKPLTIRVSNR